ncbi:hypothetical protein KFK09_001317 [Dendrobium nobile]|uniref:Uncharacterized protein n=1 Tax=Dendrobium nobile TaxID=94219 RepID=A0A8T3C7V0_DENNO|nr:hypothetical protein KFK09_001317 [Dendrobium nobile]
MNVLDPVVCCSSFWISCLLLCTGRLSCTTCYFLQVDCSALTNLLLLVVWIVAFFVFSCILLVGYLVCMLGILQQLADACICYSSFIFARG